MSRMVPPGSTIGVLGSGQLGRMFAVAARRLGYRIQVFSPGKDTPTGQVADVEVTADYHNLDAVRRFARSVDVVTFEFENVPGETIQAVCRDAPVRPNGRALETTQQRSREKQFLTRAGFPVAPFRRVRSAEELTAASDVGFPGVLKTAAWGYDGKGQALVRSVSELASAWETLNTPEAIYEQFVDCACELSVVAARGIDGAFACYGPFENVHRNHILDVSLSPASLPPKIAEDAIQIAQAICEELDIVGVICVEFFLSHSGKLLVNEIAPRPHNSGHLTIDAHVTCQFEQQVRAVCGLPLGSAEQIRPAAMANLLGDCWDGGEPCWAAALADPAIKLHLYGKREPRPGRKMGHLTALADSVETAAGKVQAARPALMAAKQAGEPRPDRLATSTHS